MGRSIALVTLLVHDYDEAIAFFTEALRFSVLEDMPLGNGKRWVVVAPPARPAAPPGAGLPALAQWSGARRLPAGDLGRQRGGGRDLSRAGVRRRG